MHSRSTEWHCFSSRSPNKEIRTIPLNDLEIKSNIEDIRAMFLNVLKIKALKLLSSVSNTEILYLN